MTRKRDIAALVALAALVIIIGAIMGITSERESAAFFKSYPHPPIPAAVMDICDDPIAIGSNGTPCDQGGFCRVERGGEDGPVIYECIIHRCMTGEIND